MEQKLTVNIYSFSFKKGIPEDHSGNGGGHVFDCRGILNPGRIEEYKTQTGRDLPVKNYLESQTQMPAFIDLAKKLCHITVSDYVQRNFTHLQISFGCTGGQHRSVYAADAMAEFLKNEFPEITVEVLHREQEEKNWINQAY
ncbi:MAG: ATP-binding protein [Flavobacteriaceae bacterium]|nr:MAG: ATP-binding protein [Flavobacteriaceae bacterium]